MKISVSESFKYLAIVFGTVTSIVALVYITQLDSDVSSNSKKLALTNFDVTHLRESVEQLRRDRDVTHNLLVTRLNSSSVNYTSSLPIAFNSSSLITEIERLEAAIVSNYNDIIAIKSFNPSICGPWLNCEQANLFDTLKRDVVAQNGDLAILRSRVSELEDKDSASSSSTGGVRSSSSTGSVTSSIISSSSSSSVLSSSSTGPSLPPTPAYFWSDLDVRQHVITRFLGSFSPLYKLRATAQGEGEFTLVGDSIACGMFSSSAKTQNGGSFASKLREMFGLTHVPGYINCNRFATSGSDAYASFQGNVDIQSSGINPSTDGFTGYNYGGVVRYRGPPGGVNFCMGVGSQTYGPFSLREDAYAIIVYYYTGPNFSNKLTLTYQSCNTVNGQNVCENMVLGTINQYTTLKSTDVYDETGALASHYLTSATLYVNTHFAQRHFIKVTGDGSTSNLAGITIYMPGQNVLSTKCESGLKMEHFATPNTFIGSGVVESFKLRNTFNGPGTTIGIVALGMNDQDATTVLQTALRTVQLVAGKFPLLFVFLPSALRNRAAFFNGVRIGLIDSIGQSRPVGIIDLSHIPESELIQKGYYSSFELRGASASNSGDGIHPGDRGSQMIAQHIKYILDSL